MVRNCAKREFSGAGPALNWEAGKRLFGVDGNHVDLDWAAAGGVLFGRQSSQADGEETQRHWHEKYFFEFIRPTPTTTVTPVHFDRRRSASAPFVDLSAGLSWEVERFKVSTGYRWERYFNAIDGGYAEHKNYDRTIDGPYFKVSVGFGS